MNHRNSLPTVSSETPNLPDLAELISKELQPAITPQQELAAAVSKLQEKHKAELAAAYDEARRKVPELVKGELEKAQMMEKAEAMRYRIPYQINNNNNPDRKVGADVPSSYLRRMAILYPIARACINFRIRQITQLEWDITTIDDIEGENNYETQITAVKNFFKHPMGHKTRLREFLTIMVDDVMTIDATCFELARLRGGQFDNGRGLKPVDPTTIALLVDEQGGTPEPPDAAYRQIINNAVIGEFTTDEMMYESMSARSYNPYGVSPLESLILQAESAMRGTMYNLNYFRESNVPEGFVTLPEDVAQNVKQVEEWQMWFDAIMAGDPRMIRRIKILPYGSTYTAAKKPEDMSFERFELWLASLTCAVFEVQPEEIGLTMNVNRATAKQQHETGTERGKLPLANFVKEIIDDVIQDEFGLPQLQWIWRNLNPVDKLEEAKVNQIKINAGVLSGDDWRINDGLPPIGLESYIMTPTGPVKVTDFATGAYKVMGDNAPDNQPLNPADADEEIAQQEGDENPTDLNDETAEKLEEADIVKWKKSVIHALKRGRKIKYDFESKYISPDIKEQIAEALHNITSKGQVIRIFNAYLDPRNRQSLKLLELAETYRKIENGEI